MSQRYGSIPASNDTDNAGSDKTPKPGVIACRPRVKILISSLAAFAILCYGAYKAFGGPAGHAIRASDDDDEDPRRKTLLDNDVDSTPLWHKQYVDHIGEDTEHNGPTLDTYNQRFLKKSVHFRGPGHPILLIIGGEGSLDPPMLYQFVNDELAEEFGAFVLSPEHR